MSMIPTITDEEVAELQERIRPVVFDKKGEARFIEPVDPRKISFTWDPTFTDEEVNLDVIGEMQMLHTYGAPVFFKPSVAEVFAQMTPELKKTATAFSLDKAEVDGAYHRSTVTFYRDPPALDPQASATALEDVLERLT